MSESDYHWYAIYTNPRAEKKTASLLHQRGIDVYLPIILAIPMALFIPWPNRPARQRFSATPPLGKVMALLVLCGVMAIPYAVDTYRVKVLLLLNKQKEIGL